MQKLAQALKKACTWSIEVNDHRVCYRSISDEFALMREIGNDDFLPEVEAECLKTGDVWVCRVYPRTPIGFVRFVAASYEALEARVLDYAEREAWRDDHLTP